MHFGLGMLVLLVIQVSFLIGGRNLFELISQKVSQVATVVSSVLAVQTNEYRATNQEKELVVSDVLTQAAQMKANDMRFLLNLLQTSCFYLIGFKALFINIMG